MKYLLLSFIILLTGCSCSYHLSKLKEKGCMKDSVRIDTVISEKEIIIKLPSDTIKESITLIDSFGIPVDIPYKYFHQGICNAGLSVFNGKLSLKMWNDSILPVTIKDTVIIKENAKIITIKPTIKELLQDYSTAIFIYSIFLIVFSFLIFLKFSK